MNKTQALQTMNDAKVKRIEKNLEYVYLQVKQAALEEKTSVRASVVLANKGLCDEAIAHLKEQDGFAVSDITERELPEVYICEFNLTWSE